MTDRTDAEAVAALAAELVRIDSRSSVSNLPLAERVEAALAGFEIERLDYADAAGVAKRAIVAHRGGPGGLALSGHMDTVPDTGWQDDPFSGRIDADGMMHGLGTADMKGPVASCIIAATGLPADIPVTLLITTDEETTKAGAALIVEASELARRAALRGIIVAEPTRLAPIRGHRGTVNFEAVASGMQAHSSTGLGVNANLALIPFLAEVKALHDRLREDPAFRDEGYDPPFPDLNIVIDNHGTAINVTVARATARIKFRYSRALDPKPVIRALEEAAARSGIVLRYVVDGSPPELPPEHPLVAAAVAATGQPARTVPFGTDATRLNALAPCVVLGPGDIGVAHSTREHVPVAELAAAIPLFRRLLREGAQAG
ncbi:M20/M25/M40 family metallo-hydrolase [Roseomonas sp. SSH11]|uniref:M20/M25/M40 family metallo-hydrolase n=1 Tax=Pararoseomonas baculiformis TaxID=2820812 RepID=A0ABS4AAU2_9PROT|nr:M20/M25/M40 family metallo-hydrolase [Pararoseomonas baculiformis]MBP0444126.1 M20/M25/M40 family metallo-hydrolase [Pararoseomonas baculiformis]